MAHIIALSDETYAALQALARPFIDTEDSVIRALAEKELERRSASPDGRTVALSGRPEVLRLEADAPENLTHTRLRSARVAGEPLHRPKWNGLVDHMHVLALKHLGSLDEVRRVSSANLREGKYEQDGYKYLPEADFSIQGVDSNLAWSHSLRLARALQVPIELRLEWRNKDGAAHPGEQAVLEWSPSANSRAATG